jgi:hypothetical protein
MKLFFNHTYKNRYENISIRSIASLSNDNTNLDPWFITGFSDGEATFTFNIIKSPSNPVGHKLQLFFLITLHKKDLPLLTLIQKYFDNKGQDLKVTGDTVRLTISSIKDLEVVIKHFDAYPLITQKLADYLLFKQVYTIICNKEHLTLEGFKKVVAIKSVLNKGLSDKLKFEFNDIIPATRPLVNLPEYIPPYWLAGFTSAEGHFGVKLSKNTTTTTGYQVALKFTLTQHLRDKLLLENFISFYKCGTVWKTESRDWGVFEVTKFSDIESIIIPFFQKYKVVGVKAKDFESFCFICKIMKEGRHKTEQGLLEIQAIKNNMNKSRTLSESTD